MEVAGLLWFHLLLLVIFCKGFHVQGPSGPLTVQLGDSVMLPCFVETPLPMEELEVAWKRTDSGSLVHLWQNGESRPESQNQRYHERAHFFSEEVAHGNFSLLLTNVTREDTGVYKCVVHTNQDSDKTLIEIMETERLIVSGGHVISAYAGEEITLNCSVDSHIPSEKIEEVSWKKKDEDLLVLLYQEGDILTESTHGRFKDRVEFFSAEDRNKGNFSMRLKDVRTEDKGLYICSAFSGTLSDNTTVEVQQLGVSSMHIGIIVLCLLVFVIGSLILIYLYFSYTSFQKKNNSRRARVIQCAHVLCPNITMSIVFILWGVTEGSFTEAATCSALNFVRIVFLFWIADHPKSFKGCCYQLINRLTFPLLYVVITAVAYLPIIVDFWHKTDTAVKLIIPFLVLILLHVIDAVCGRIILQKITGWSYIVTEFSNILRVILITLIFGAQTFGTVIVLLFPMLSVFSFLFFTVVQYLVTRRSESSSRNTGIQKYFRLFVSIMIILEILNVSGSIYFHYTVVTDMKERDALTCVTMFLYVLTMMTLSTSLKQLSESDSRNTAKQQLTRPPESDSQSTQQPVWSVVVFMIGSGLVVFVNAAALLVELILKARTGQRTVDLRLIVIPTECVFAVFWQICFLFRTEIQRLLFWSGSKQEQMDSNTPSSNHDHELQELNPASNHLGT